MSNINDSYFDGYYKDIWRNIIPEILTEREVAFMLSYFSLEAGDKVLDLMCGYGRHALALAQKGILVTAVDNLEAYTSDIAHKSAEKNLPVTVITGSVLDNDIEKQINVGQPFNLVICMGNSLNFFDPEGLEKLVRKVSGWLKPSGYFLVNSWSIKEIALNTFRERTAQRLGNFQFNTESRQLDAPSRIETVTTMIPPQGEPETRNAIDYIYSLDELAVLFRKHGLNLHEVFSIPGKKKFTEGEPRAYIVAVKE